MILALWAIAYIIGCSALTGIAIASIGDRARVMAGGIVVGLVAFYQLLWPEMAHNSAMDRRLGALLFAGMLVGAITGLVMRWLKGKQRILYQEPERDERGNRVRQHDNFVPAIAPKVRRANHVFRSTRRLLIGHVPRNRTPREVRGVKR